MKITLETGDITAQVNTNTYGLTRFAELFGKYGTDKVLACWQSWMDICETELRKEIAKVPDGLYGPETDYLDDDGIDLNKSYRISASLEVKGDTLRFILDSDDKAGDESRVLLPHPELFEAVRPGTNILIDDGKVRLNVLEVEPGRIVTEPSCPRVAIWVAI